MADTAPHAGDAAPPQHVAIIMDGNGRWARSRGLPRVAGHRRGAESVREAVKAASRLGLRYLTLFGFSSENWKRPFSEVEDLMGLLRRYLRSEVSELHAQGVRLRVIGDRGRLARDIVDLIADAEALTKRNAGLTLVLALSYGSRAELTQAVRRIAADVGEGRITVEQIDEAMVGSHLYTADIPDPDLLIRTSGEQRVSNFLLWQCAYAEMIFLDILWPDFSGEHLAEAVREYARRERRYGMAGR
ncbi:MAG: isoprenyl transferase [Alphaproteobacteria bacterium]